MYFTSFVILIAGALLEVVQAQNTTQAQTVLPKCAVSQLLCTLHPR